MLMLSRARIVLGLVATIGALAVAAGGAAGGGVTAAPKLGTSSKFVTLITGDRVHYTRAQDGRETVVVEPAVRKEGLAPYFTMTSDAAGYYVIPSDVRPGIEADVLDRELFDVRDLVAAGLDDGSSDQLPVIATYAGKPSAAELERESDALPGSKPVRPLARLASVAVTVERSSADEFWDAVDGKSTTRLAGGLKKLWLDAPLQSSLSESVPQVGAPAAWNAGYDGSGVIVAVLDTGVDATHPDLAGKVVASENFTSDPSAADGNGHGTHVASIVAGTGAAAGGTRRGVAPGARIVSAKVLNDGGSGATSWAAQGIDWAVRQGARVVNMSFSSGPTDGTDFLSQAVNTYTASSGALFVASAGNSGPGPSTVSAPSVADSALSVASVDKQDVISSFSSRGPRRGDGALKPEIAAPGGGIVAARAAGTSLGDPQGDSYTRLSGTSMSAPHVAGAAALLAQKHPEWDAGELKSALVGAAKPVSTTAFAQGAGRLDVERAIEQAVRAEPATLNFGSFDWPQTGAPVARTITYRNDGTQPVTLQLAAGASNLVGTEAPADALRLSADTLLVPASGSASVTVTLDPTRGATGAFAGQLVATSADGATVVRTPLGYHKEAETHRLTLRVTGSRGQPAGGVFEAVRIDSLAPSPDPFVDMIYSIWPSGGTAQVDLPVGVYDVAGDIVERSVTLDRTTAFVEHEVDLRNADAELDVDARKGIRLRPEAEEVTQPFSLSMGSVWRLGERFAYLRTFTWGHSPGAELYGIPSRTTPSPAGRYAFETRFALAPPLVTLRAKRAWREPFYPSYFVAPDGLPKLEGDLDTTIVPIGDGDAEDFAGKDLAGKIAFVELRPPATGNPYNYLFPQADRAIRNSAAAGAVAALFYVDLPGAVLYQPTPAFGVALPVLSLAYDEGKRLARLLDGSPIAIAVDAVASPATSYHLNYLYPNGVPATPPQTARRSDLARVPMRLHGDGSDLRYSVAVFSHGELPSGGMVPTGVRGPAEHTAYIGPPSASLGWRKVVNMFRSDGGWLHGFQSDDLYARAGTYPVETWFAGPFVPGSYDMAQEQRALQFPVLCGFCRERDVFLPTGLDLDAEPNHWAYTQWWLHQARMFAGEQELELKPLSEDFYGLGYFELPPGPGAYRLEHLAPDPRGGGRETRTTWRFFSQGAPAPGSVPAGTFCVLSGFGANASCRFEPLISLRYELGVDLDNSVAAGRAHRFEINASHNSQAGGAPIAGVTVAVSYDDGGTWQPVRVTKAAGGAYAVTVDHPQGGYVSVKTAAWDAVGNRVEQEVIRAYRLRT